MKPREYCCCAIPISNAGVYAVLLEQFALGIIVGLLSVATPSIVGAATPSFARWVLGIVSFVAGGIQILGFIGAAKDKHILFRRYLTLHSLVTIAAFAIAIAWTIISATRHSTAKTNCISNFFDTSDSDLNSESQVLCDIFPWVDVGIMGALIVIFALVHIYFYVVLSSYSNEQNDDYGRYSALNDPVNASSVPLYNRGGTSPENGPYSDEPKEHYRKESAASMSDIIGQPVRQPTDEGFSTYNYNNYNYQPQQQAYTAGYPGRQGTYDQSVSHPSLERPIQAQPHPSEGYRYY